ncbi:hypothetical protein GMMP1_540016 [Candidatus Magnetomoraceae bacterium gMMP-1]
MSEDRQKSSISRYFSQAFIIVVLFILLIFSILIIGYNIKRVDYQVNEKLQNVLKVAGITLPAAIWQFNYDYLNDFMHALFLEDIIVYVKILADNEVLAQKAISEYSKASFDSFQENPKFATGIIDIIYQENKIGRVEIVVSRIGVYQELILNASGVIILLIFLILAIAFTSIFITKRYILKPLLKLKTSAGMIASGNLDAVIDKSNDDEIGSLAEDFDTMRESIKILFENLKEANKIKENYARTLEYKVEERTAELRGASEKLRQSEEKYRGLYNSSKDLIVFLDMQYSIQDVNPAFLEMTGYTLTEVKQRYMNELTPEKMIEKERYIIKNQVIKKGYSEEFEKELIKKDESILYLSTRIWILKNEHGQPTGIWGIGRDITERKRVEQLRENVERMVRHDLKTPLGSIIGFSEVLQEDENLTEEQLEWIKRINKDGHQILHMIDHSLDVFKMEEGTYEFKPCQCDLVKIFHKLDDDLASLKKSKSLKVDFYLQNKPLSYDYNYWVSGESMLLQNLFGNLLKNAVEASPKSCTVSIYINKNENYHEIIIHNSGVIPHNIRNSFFERYSTSGKKNGTGLGTYSALLIAKIHGGTIKFTTSEKQGTSLIVKLPRNKINIKESKIDVKETFERDHSPLNILVAEDNPNNQLIIQIFLNNTQYKIDMAKNGRQAVEKFKLNKYDLIFMDIHMPVMNGLDAMKQIRNYESKHAVNTSDPQGLIPIVALTADSSKEMHDKCLMAGGTDFLNKPINKQDKLIKAILKYTRR